MSSSLCRGICDSGGSQSCVACVIRVRDHVHVRDHFTSQQLEVKHINLVAFSNLVVGSPLVGHNLVEVVSIPWVVINSLAWVVCNLEVVIAGSLPSLVVASSLGVVASIPVVAFSSLVKERILVEASP